MKTGCDELGQILAHQVQFIADTGAYATLGPAVVDFAVEHATGPYRIPHVDIEGLAVYTNNGVLDTWQVKSKRLSEALDDHSLCAKQSHEVQSC